MSDRARLLATLLVAVGIVIAAIVGLHDDSGDPAAPTQLDLDRSEEPDRSLTAPDGAQVETGIGVVTRSESNEPSLLLPVPTGDIEPLAGPPGLAGTVVRKSDRSRILFVSVRVLGPPGESGEPALLANAFGRFGSFAFDDAASLESATQLSFTWPECYPIHDPTADSVDYESSNRTCTLVRDLDPADRTRQNLWIELDTGWSLRGSVEDESGKPVAGVPIGIGGLIVSQSAADGSFVVHDLPWASATVSVHAFSESHAVSRPASGESVADVDIRLVRASVEALPGWKGSTSR